MVGEDNVGVVAHHQVVANRYAGGAQVLDFFEKSRRIDDDAVADHRAKVRLQHAGREQRQLVSLAGMHHGMAGVGAAVVANDHVVLGGEDIDDLSLGLVAPLQTDDTSAGHGLPISEKFGSEHKKRP